PPRNHRIQQRLKHAELADISNLTASNELRPANDHRRLDSLGNRLWHSDASFRDVPGALSMLFAHVVPPVGGETEFADLRAADDVMWDNRCTLHRGRAYDDATYPRDLRRVTTKDHYAAA